MVALKRQTESKGKQTDKPPRPVKGPVDYAALRKKVMKRFQKVRAHLAK
jgi:hypothetical protein